MDVTTARQHQAKLRTIMRRRQYTALGGYVSRALRGDDDPGRTCFAFVPLTVTAVWGQHAEISLTELTAALNLKDMARRPQEALLSWITALQVMLKQLPASLSHGADTNTGVLQAPVRSLAGCVGTVGSYRSLSLCLRRRLAASPTFGWNPIVAHDSKHYSQSTPN